jgi:hypothetical protein
MRMCIFTLKNTLKCQNVKKKRRFQTHFSAFGAKKHHFSLEKAKIIVTLQPI